MESLRCFVAVELDPRTRAELARLQDVLRRATSLPAKWVAPEGIHLTLCFLGEISQERVVPTGQAIAATCAEFGPFELELAGLGVFPNPQRPQVLWVGLNGQTAELARLQKALEARLIPMGYHPENRPFSPHLTLARLRPEILPAACQELAAALSRTPVPPGRKISVTAVSLIKSTLTPAGAIYTRLSTARLGGAA
jgi:RNA 2',3'-cyclic 3'-phosphodiesterase